MSGYPPSAISRASGEEAQQQKGRVDPALGGRSFKLLLLLSLCVTGWVIRSLRHVQEFVGSGIEPIADFVKGVSCMYRARRECGIRGPAQLRRTQSAGGKLAAAIFSRRCLSSRRSRRLTGRSPAAVVRNNGSVSGAKRRPRRTT